MSCFAALLFALTPVANAQHTTPLYKRSGAPTEQRVNDLLKRMTVEEKVRQLDMYSSAREIMSAHTDETHAALDASFVPDKAQSIWG